MKQCNNCMKAPFGGKFCPYTGQQKPPTLTGWKCTHRVEGTPTRKPIEASLCVTCSKADVSCPIFSPGKYVGSCIEYIRNPNKPHKIDFLKPDKLRADSAVVTGVRSDNVGSSDYATHKIQPWEIWEVYNLNPWDADIVKRVLRTKADKSMSPAEQRILDYRKIIHVAEYAIERIKNGKDTRF